MKDIETTKIYSFQISNLLNTTGKQKKKQKKNRRIVIKYKFNLASMSGIVL